jgi:hypothetical protein
MDHVLEFLSPDFHEHVPYRYLLLFLIGVLGLSRERLRPAELILVVMLTSMSLYSVRYIPICAIVYAPVLSWHGGRLIEERGGRIARFLRDRSAIYGRIDSSAKGYAVPVLLAAVLVLLAAGKIPVRFPEGTTPTGAIEYLEANPIEGNMFNNDEFGDYVIYSLFPRYKVFVDGRTDMYGPPVLKEYFKVAGVEPGWEEVLVKYKIDYVFFQTDSPLTRRLSETPGWKKAYTDNVATIFLRDLPAGAAR